MLPKATTVKYHPPEEVIQSVFWQSVDAETQVVLGLRWDSVQMAGPGALYAHTVEKSCSLFCVELYPVPLTASAREQTRE